MKKKDIITMIAILAAGGCASNDEVQQKDPVPIRLTASVSVEAKTRSVDSQGEEHVVMQTPATRGVQETAIASGEKVYVWGQETGSSSWTYLQAWDLTSDGSNNLSGTQKYYPLDGSTLTMAAVHGNFAEALTDGSTAIGTLTHSVEADQETAGNYEKSDLLWGTASGSDATESAVNIPFTHKLSKIEVTLTPGNGYTDDDLSSATVKFHNVKPSIGIKVDDGTLPNAASGDAIIITPRKVGRTYEAVVPPQTLSNPDAFISVTATKSGLTLTSTVPNSVSTYASDTKYVYDVKVFYSPIDLSMVDNSGNARASMTTANCYLVHDAGLYKLPLVYGNAIKNGAANTVAYNPGTVTNGLANFVNHADAAITGPWITKSGSGVNAGMGLTASSATLLWQDVAGLITEVGISHDGNYLEFTVGNYAAGNAVIAVKNSSGNILWSWHIWATDETFATSTLSTIATGSHNYLVTPVNLGWVPTGGGGKQGYQPYFQWGRKDPLVPAAAYNGLTSHDVYDISGASITAYTYQDGTNISTIGTTIQNPTYQYRNINTGGPVNVEYNNMWDAQNSLTENVTTASTKTIYDPCPPDFCVPSGNLAYYMGDGNSDYTSTRTMLTWDSDNLGATWTDVTTGEALYFPASNYRQWTSGTFDDAFVTAGVYYGYIWTSSTSSRSNSRGGNNLGIYSNKWQWRLDARAHGFPVRAVAEE